MLTRILTVVLFLGIMGLLVAQRFFATPSQVSIMVVDFFEENQFFVGEELHRGQKIETKAGYIKLSIDNVVSLWLAADTRVELHRLFQDELVVKLTKGRIVVDHQGQIPFRVETNYTTSLVYSGIATFVNYDFLETIHVIPLSGSVQINIDSTGEQLLTPVPLSIHETDPVSFKKLDVNLAAGDSASFYEWTGVLTQDK